jgi:putative ABC transport system permease protein
MFSVANAVLLAPLPYRAPEQLATLWTEVPTQNIREGRSAYLDVEQWRRETKRISEMAVFDPVFGDAYEFVGAEHISAVRTSPNLFPPLGVQPLHGRSFSAEEAERGEAVAVISHRFWQMRFAAPQAAIGASVELDGARSRIIGILPAELESARLDPGRLEPHSLSPDLQGGRARVARTWFVVGRLRPNVTLEPAQPEMSAMARRLDEQSAAPGGSRGISVVSVQPVCNRSERGRGRRSSQYRRGVAGAQREPGSRDCGVEGSRSE